MPAEQLLSILTDQAQMQQVSSMDVPSVAVSAEDCGMGLAISPPHHRCIGWPLLSGYVRFIPTPRFASACP